MGCATILGSPLISLYVFNPNKTPPILRLFDAPLGSDILVPITILLLPILFEVNDLPALNPNKLLLEAPIAF